ncbi:MAG TPA: hypothetical protein VG754_08990 [Verrucomicrobiae bacterium]|nr:hypothetical protein [Verrucomicrobiae bacterium]
MRLTIKIGAAILAFIPMVLMFAAVGLSSKGLISQALGIKIFAGCGIFYFPVLSIMSAVNTFHVGKIVQLSVLLIGLFSWSLLIAWMLWKIAGTLQGEEEPRKKFDWIGFQVRFVCGFIVGCLSGWRFVRYTTSTKTLVVATLLTGFTFGVAFGLMRTRELWSGNF